MIALDLQGTTAGRNFMNGAYDDDEMVEYLSVLFLFENGFRYCVQAATSLL